jgi:hypothetical protein
VYGPEGPGPKGRAQGRAQRTGPGGPGPKGRAQRAGTKGPGPKGECVSHACM